MISKKNLILTSQQELATKDYGVKLANLLYDSMFPPEKITLNNKEINSYKKKLGKILKGVPLQYVMKNTNFYGYDFYVNNNVLIPRFETEELVYNTIGYIRDFFPNPISIVDIGTGSGVIAITIKKELSNVKIIATDISRKALSVAKKNAKLLKADICFLKGDMLKPLEGKKVDIIISNPPYIKLDEDIDSIVIENEPKRALFGGKDGLKYYRRIFEGAISILNKKSMLALEISPSISQEITILVEQYFPKLKYIIKKDMAGRERMLFIFNNID